MSAWTLVYRDWDRKQQPLREALCTLGNGYLATRGAAEEADAGGVHYPGTYLAGGYNRLVTKIAGREVENEDLVNWPNWLCLTFRPEGGEPFHVDTVRLEEFRQELDLRHGVLERRMRFSDTDGRCSRLISRRLVHMDDPHLAAVSWRLIPENWTGRVEIRSSLDGTVKNRGVARYRMLNDTHLRPLACGRLEMDAAFLEVETSQSRIRMAQVARTRVWEDSTAVEVDRETVAAQDRVCQTILVDAHEGRPLQVEKVVAVFTSRDRAISEPALAAREAIGRAGTWEDLLRSHRRAWDRLWHRCDIRVTGDAHTQVALRLHIFHLLQTVSMHSIDLDVGVPARGLHGEAYRGHVFWDELYIFPFLNLSVPEITRALLIYRYRRLPEARRAARKLGLPGALYPWQSGSDGQEESQVVHLNPRSGRWLPDETHLQRHVNAAVAYNIWQYFQATDDREFLSFYGAEMLVEIARFWSGVVVFNRSRGRYEIRGVVGPDEYHTRYPGADRAGVDNNAYTNLMAAWVLHCAARALELLAPDRRRELLEELQVSAVERSRWEEIGRRMFLPFHDGELISQFEGYEKLAELDWEAYRKKHGDIQRLDRLLEAQGDTPNGYKAAKQADVLMLFYLFSAEELAELFRRLGYEFRPRLIPRNVKYYSHRTSHGSSLSRVIHCWVRARSDRKGSWGPLQRALDSDIRDVQGGTTQEGVHLGAMAGTTDLVQRGYAGIELRGEALWLNPSLPEKLREMSFRIRYRGAWLSLRVTHDELAVDLEEGGPGPTRIGFAGRIHRLEEGEARVFRLPNRSSSTSGGAGAGAKGAG
jgi:trehalose/maltose hydrolase-like predicted phosphorylase